MSPFLSWNAPVLHLSSPGSIIGEYDWNIINELEEGVVLSVSDTPYNYLQENTFINNLCACMLAACIDNTRYFPERIEITRDLSLRLHRSVYFPDLGNRWSKTNILFPLPLECMCILGEWKPKGGEGRDSKKCFHHKSFCGDGIKSRAHSENAALDQFGLALMIVCVSPRSDCPAPGYE